MSYHVPSIGAPPPANVDVAASAPGDELEKNYFREHCTQVWKRTDRLFGVLLTVQWLVCIGVALWISPKTWIGQTSAIHLHVWLAIFLGGTIAGFPLLMIALRPGAVATRHVVAVSQMLFSGLLIHLTGGRIETHFHVFGSLAFLAFYRDWRVLVTASAVVGMDHFLRGVYWPESVFGMATGAGYRWLEHVGWVVFEDTFLFVACRQSLREMRVIARRRAEMAEINVRIEKRVQERTEALRLTNENLEREVTFRRDTEAALILARDAANEANRAKSTFLANMSHEIRTPMNGVIGMTGLLLDSKLEGEQSGFVEVIRQSGENLLTIINEILDFSKIESGHLDFDRRPFDLITCVEDALDLFSVESARKEIDLAYLFDSKVSSVVIGDSLRLRQILVNLIGNALKFTDQGEVIVEVRAEMLPAGPFMLGNSHLKALDSETSGEQEWVRFEFRVRDTGIGIPADRVDDLFKPFSQVDSSVTRRHGGTGLGLAIVKRLVEMMGGEIGVETKPGEGTTFIFTLVTKTTHDVRRDDTHTRVPYLSERRVLIVDDNETNRRVLSFQTAGWGMAPVAFEEPRDALAWLEQGYPVDVALVDYNMPSMNGIALAAEIQAMPDRENLPLVLLSSSIPPRLVGPASKDRFAMRLTKPIRQSDLFDTLRAVLGNADGRNEPSDRRPRIDGTLAARFPLRILLVEDNLINQKVASRTLQQMGYRVDVSCNGLEALEACGDRDYDLVFMDVQMPEMDGLEATRRIRSDIPVARQPRIVAMTASALAEDRVACLAAGMDDYLSKPVRAQMLSSAIESTAHALKARQEAAAAPEA